MVEPDSPFVNDLVFEVTLSFPFSTVRARTMVLFEDNGRRFDK